MFEIEKEYGAWEHKYWAACRIGSSALVRIAVARLDQISKERLCVQLEKLVKETKL
jgi:hypothetical protein